MITNHRVAYKLLTFTICQIAFRQQQLSALKTEGLRVIYSVDTRGRNAAASRGVANYGGPDSSGGGRGEREKITK